MGHKDEKMHKPSISVNTTPEAMKGSYSNAVKVSVTNFEVIIDFAFVFPLEDEQEKQGILTNRVIMTHDLASKLAQSINTTIDGHKKK